MACALKISEGSSLAMHAMGLLALRPAKPLPVRAIAGCFHVSEAHLAKILQRLVKVGLLRSVRGPKGGFSLARAPAETTLLEVFTAIGGRVEGADCLFGVPLCDGQSCILGKVMADANRLLYDHLTRTNLEEISRVFLDGRIELPFEQEEST
jgi:Rrf2 family protein